MGSGMRSPTQPRRAQLQLQGCRTGQLEGQPAVLSEKAFSYFSFPEAPETAVQ